MSPSLAYKWAFDLCASWATRAPAPVAVLASEPDFQQEMLQRLNEKGVLVLNSENRPELKESGGHKAVVLTKTGDSATSLPGTCSLVVWIEPEANQHLPILPEMIGLAQQVIVVTANGTRRLLPEWQSRSTYQERRPLPAARIRSLLEREGFRKKTCIGIPGLTSLTFGFAGRFATRIQRYDLADRFYSRMRQSLLTCSRLTEYTPMSVMDFRKAS